MPFSVPHTPPIPLLPIGLLPLVLIQGALVLEAGMVLGVGGVSRRVCLTHRYSYSVSVRF